MININSFYELINTITNKAEQGGFSIPQFNIAIPIVTQKYIDKCIKEYRMYQLNQNKNFAGIARIERALFDIIIRSTIDVSSSGIGVLPTDWYDTKTISYNYVTQNPLSVTPKPIIETDNIDYFLNSQLNAPSKQHPVCSYVDGAILFAPKDLGSGKVKMTYFKSTPDPVWGWTLVNNEAVYNPSTSVNIPLSSQTNDDLANMFCQYLGLAIKDEFIEQFSQTEENKAQ